MKKIRVGFVGCGRVSHRHFDSFNINKDSCQLVAVCDADLQKARKAAEGFTPNFYTNIADMLNNEQLDLVAIATPNGLHAQNIKEILDRKINVVTEKPLATKWQDGLDVHKYAKQQGVELFVIYQNRYNHTIQHLKQAITSGRLGKIYMVAANVFWQRAQSYYEKDATWHGTKDLDGGAFMTQASHYVDMIQWLVNSKPKSVYGKAVTLARNIETEDCGMAMIEWENGVLGSINLTVLTYPKDMEGSVTIICENGTVRVGGIALNEIQLWEIKQPHPDDDVIKGTKYQVDSVYGYGHPIEYANIFQYLLGDTTVDVVRSEDGLNSLEILDAIYKSNKAGSPISLPYPR